MKCQNPNCGHEIQETWKICPYCQTPVAGNLISSSNAEIEGNVIKDSSINIVMNQEHEKASRHKDNLTSHNNNKHKDNYIGTGDSNVHLSNNVLKGSFNIDQSRHTHIHEDENARITQKYKQELDSVLRKYGYQGLITKAEELDQLGLSLGLSLGDCRKIRIDMSNAYDEEQLQRKKFEDKRSKFRLKLGNNLISNELATLEELVGYLNKHKYSAYPPFVDTDCDENWRPAYLIEDIFNHPKIQFICSKTGSNLQKENAAICKSCLRVFARQFISDQNICIICESSSSKNTKAEAALSVDKYLNPIIEQNAWKKIPSGCFDMGSPDSEFGRDIDEVMHKVSITNSFAITITPVTEKVYNEIMGIGTGKVDYPIVQVSWFEAVKFCNRLSQRLKLPIAYTENNEKQILWNRNSKGIRLLTEAEWEYACRAGSTGPFFYGDVDNLHETTVYQTEEIEPLCSRQPNSFELYDMLGNVWEWVWDAKSDYPSTPATNPTNESIGFFKCVRGGCFSEPPENCRCAKRFFVNGKRKSPRIGFRVCRTI